MHRFLLVILCLVLASCVNTKPELQNVLTRTVYKTIPVPEALKPKCEYSESTKQAVPGLSDLLVMTHEQRASAYFVFIVQLETDFKLCQVKVDEFNKWLDKQEAIVQESAKPK